MSPAVTPGSGVKPVLLDLFCCEGGAATGYDRAGFDVIGVDIEDQKRYPFRFMQSDWYEALAIMAPLVDAIHASPPCQHYSVATPDKSIHPDLIDPVRQALIQTGKPWIIENVVGAPLRVDFKLCGTMFGLKKVQRHRLFETSWHGFDFALGCNHDNVQNCQQTTDTWLFDHTEKTYAKAMGVEWMSRHGAREAIPPAYTEYLGGLLMAQIRS